ncbi:hypothetical protein [Amycolatopsis keratiniphila]|uniref:Uncharacterized protein n=1 Tax=Amycolatopsis keratiniphila TaxID=129921 RepID=W6HZG4_9PSEU|nr:hypothetical protein [Amycolatopsis keratiniphila]AHJ58517.1 hypothetical protein AORI_P002 [Amycolatopsis keratiniphila]
MHTVKVSVATWLGSQVDACQETLERTFPAEQLKHFQETKDDPVLYAGYLMGRSDAAVDMKATLEKAHLGDRKIPVPEPGHTDTSSSPALGTPEAPEPLTVGELRAYLACRPDLADDLPVVVGGHDFDEPSRKLQGLADAVWTDAQGAFGGRLVIAAMGLGLSDL